MVVTDSGGAQMEENRRAWADYTDELLLAEVSAIRKARGIAAAPGEATGGVPLSRVECN